MSEKLNQSAEQSGEIIHSSPESVKNLERIKERAEAVNDDPIEKHIASLNKEVAAQATSAEESKQSEQHPEAGPQIYSTTKQLKTDAYKRSLSHIQSRLSAPNKALSKVVHQPVVEAVSEATARTIARPSVLLGGGLGAFAGSASLLFMSKYYGFSYNYTVFILLFIGGFFAGGLVELLFKAVRRKH